MSRRLGDSACKEAETSLSPVGYLANTASLTGTAKPYEGGRIQEAACWAHVRRKFYDLQVAHASLLAAEVLKRIGELYAIESEIRGKPPEERLQTLHKSRPPSARSLASVDANYPDSHLAQVRD